MVEKPEHVLRREAAVVTEAERWLRAYLSDEFGITDENNGYGTTFDSFVDQAATNDEDYLLVLGSDAYGEVPDEFYRNLEIFVGHPVPRAPYFSCSC